MEIFSPARSGSRISGGIGSGMSSGGGTTSGGGGGRCPAGSHLGGGTEDPIDAKARQGRWTGIAARRFMALRVNELRSRWPFGAPKMPRILVDGPQRRDVQAGPLRRLQASRAAYPARSEIRLAALRLAVQSPHISGPTSSKLRRGNGQTDSRRIRRPGHSRRSGAPRWTYVRTPGSEEFSAHCHAEAGSRRPARRRRRRTTRAMPAC